MNKLVVVGDKFSEFAKLNGTITLTQLAMMAQMPAKIFTQKNHLISKKLNVGIAALCVGGGEGIAMSITRN